MNRKPAGIFIFLSWAHPAAYAAGPGFPLQSFGFTRGKASGISAAIPCAFAAGAFFRRHGSGKQAP
jgi:hypothetical protein